MKIVYRLDHKRKIEPDGERWVTCGSRIGYYSSRQKAEETIDRYKKIEGFRDYPDDFVIEEVEVDFDDFNFI